MKNHTTTAKSVIVQVIIPVHNAASTIVETVTSAMHQRYGKEEEDTNTDETAVDTPRNHDSTTITEPSSLQIEIHVCCFDDGSTDTSWDLLQSLVLKYANERNEDPTRIPTTLHIQRHETSRGAGVARNRAVAMYATANNHHDNKTVVELLCWLDADDLMRPTRVYEQVSYFMNLCCKEQSTTLLGCQFERDPIDATWHYTHWANHVLTNERLYLEQFREVTLIQPTWMMFKSRFWELGGYVEPSVSTDEESSLPDHPLIDATYETPQTLRLAEDLRFFHEHLFRDGTLHLLRTKQPLVVYRHTPGQTQSAATPRKLLVRIRVSAFSRAILRRQPVWKSFFCIWGAGRDGKDFYKALSPELQAAVYCFVDVDDKKIMQIQHYCNIPIVHFSLLARDSNTRNQLHQAWCEQEEETTVLGRINKGRHVSTTTTVPMTTLSKTTESSPPFKKQRLTFLSDSKLDMTIMSQIPVVVCVAMYRTNGALERNVESIGRTEGKDLWYFN